MREECSKLGTYEGWCVFRAGESALARMLAGNKKITMKKSTFLLIGMLAPGLALADTNHHVYALLNQKSGNVVLSYVQGTNGKLKVLGQTATGGLGTGAGLGSQGGLALSQSGRYLYAVNAGDNSVSMFSVNNGALTLLDVQKTGGNSPVSVTESGGLVYVVNQGTTSTAGNIQGFVNFLGELIPIPRATAPLSGVGVIPVEIKFTPNGSGLVVAEKVSNYIDTFALDNRGIPSDVSYQISNGKTPFGFDFNSKGDLFITEAAGGAANASTISSYSFNKQLGLNTLTRSAKTNQSAACWDVVSPNGRFVYTGNAGSGNISGFRIGTNGTLNLIDSTGVSGITGGHTIDLTMRNDGEFLYALSSVNQVITTFRVSASGTLTIVDTQTGLPNGTSGLVAR